MKIQNISFLINLRTGLLVPQLAAITALLHPHIRAAVTNPYVHVIALDFSKAFDTVRHSTLMEKFANFSCSGLCIQLAC